MIVKPEELKVGQVVKCASEWYRGYLLITGIEPWKWGGKGKGRIWVTGERVRKNGEPRVGAKYLKNTYADEITAIVKQPEEASQP